MNSLTRNQVYKVINDERKYQDQFIRPNPGRSDGTEKSVGEYLVLIDHYSRRASDAWCQEGGNTGALHELRKLVAVAVACMEDHGVPERYLGAVAGTCNPPPPGRW